MEEPESPSKNDILSLKEEFFQVLNLQATKRIKVKYCRTIKERLRATTKEESLSLPGSRVKLTLSPLRRGEEEPSSSREETTSPRKDEPQEDEDQIQIRGGINVLKSIKKRKSERLKNLNPTPSTKSLLSYLQPKLSNDDEVEDSSSFESDSNETVEPFRLKKMMVSVNRLTNKSIIHQNPRIRFAFPDSLEESSTEKICGFSNEISEKTFSKNEQLKNIISDLESEITEKERESRREKIEKGFTKAYATPGSEPRGLLPQSSSLALSTIRARSLRSLTESDTDEDNTEEIFENKLDVKIVDSSTDSLISTETEVASSIKSEFVEEEYSEFTTKDLLTPAKAEHFSHIDIEEDSKMFQQGLLNQEMVQIYELPEEKPQIFRQSPEGGPVQSSPPEGGPVQLNPAQSEIFIRPEQKNISEEDNDASFSREFHLSSESEMEPEPEPIKYSELFENPPTVKKNPPTEKKINETVIIVSDEDEEMPILSQRSEKKTKTGGPGRPKKKLRDKYKELFIQKQLQLLENLKKTDPNSADAGDRRKTKADRKQLNFAERKLKRLRDGVKFSNNKLRSTQTSKSEKPKRKFFKNKLSDRGDSNKSDSGIEVRLKPLRRRSLEVAKLGAIISKPYRQIILERKSAKSSAPPERRKPADFEIDRDDRELSEILKDVDNQKIERKRRGEPTFLIPYSSGDSRLDRLVNRMRQESFVRSRISRLSSNLISILVRNSYWTDKQISYPEAEKNYTVRYLGPDQISKPTRKSKTFSRLSRPSMDDVLKARRILGIERADFNYDAEENENESRRKHSPRELKIKKKRLLKKKEKKIRRSDILKGKDVVGAKRDHSRTFQVNDDDEFDIDNIEPVVDNEPVDDWNDSSDSMDSDENTRWIGKYTCRACGTSFCNPQGLEHHDKLACKPFSCNFCDKRFRSHKLCMNHQDLHRSSSRSSFQGSSLPGNTGSSFHVKFNCDQCSQTFFEESVFYRHRDAVHNHSNAKPFKCTLKGCGKSFHLRDQLDIHASKHNQQDVVWKCQKCDARFQSKEKLKGHIKNVHEMQKTLRAQFNMINVSKDLDSEDENYDLDRMLVLDIEDIQDQEPLQSDGIERNDDMFNKNDSLEPALLVQQLQAANKDLDVEVSLVEMDDVLEGDLRQPLPGDMNLHHPPVESIETIVHEHRPDVHQARATQHTFSNQSTRAVPDANSRNYRTNQVDRKTSRTDEAGREVEQEDSEEDEVDLNTTEDIETIENFLRSEVGITEKNESFGKLTEQPSSENIGDIQKFLELSNLEVHPNPEPVPTIKEVTRETTSGSGDSRFRIPRSPQFKKRLLDKEIVSIKGMDPARKIKKVKKISFEEQLTKADMADKPEKKDGRRSKNKSSMKDFMITKKYAKLNLEIQGIVKSKSKQKIVTSEKGKHELSSQDKLSSNKSRMETKVLSGSKNTNPEISQLKLVQKPETVVGTNAVKPAVHKPVHKPEPTVQKPVHKPEPAVQKSVHKPEPVVHKSIHKPEPVKVSNSKKAVSDQQPLKPEGNMSIKSDVKTTEALSNLNFVANPIKSTPSGQVKKRPIPPFIENPRKLALPRRSSVESKKSLPKPPRKPVDDISLKPETRTSDLKPTEIDLERIVREPGRLWSKHLRQSSKPTDESKPSLNPLDSLPSTESLKLVLSGVAPGPGVPKEEERPRDPRLHSSKLINHSKSSISIPPSVSVQVSAMPSEPQPTPLITISPLTISKPAPTVKDKPASLPVKLSKMGLPAPVPAASLSSEDESIGGEGPRGSLGGEGPRGSFSTTPVINSSVPTQGGKGYYTENYKEDDKPAPPSFGAALLSKAALATAASSQLPATASFTSQQQGSAVYTTQHQTTAVYSTQQQTTAVYTTQQQEVTASFSNLLPTNFPTFEQKTSGVPVPSISTVPTLRRSFTYPSCVSSFQKQNSGSALIQLTPSPGYTPGVSYPSTIHPSSTSPAPRVLQGGSEFRGKPPPVPGVTRLKLPALPKPVPAAIATPARTTLSCGTCKAEFKSLGELGKHESSCRNQFQS